MFIFLVILAVFGIFEKIYTNIYINFRPNGISR